MARSGVRGEREGRAEPATSVSRATRDQSDPRSDRPARAAWAVQRLLAALVRSTAAPSRLVNLVGGDDGARAFGADADDDGVVAAAPASHGVIANRRH